MISKTLAERYSIALVKIALDKGDLVKYKQQVSEFLEILELKPDLLMLLKAQQISKKDKIDILAKIFDKLELSKDVANSFYLLVQKSRANLFVQFCHSFLEYCGKHLKQKIATVVSAKPLNDTALQNLQIRLQQTTDIEYFLKNTVDESILGGFIFIQDNVYYDFSALNRLNSIKQNFLELA